MRTYKIAVVDNDREELEFMRDALIKSGLFEVAILAHTADELLHWMGTVSDLPDVIVTDLHMPIKDGRELLNIVKNTTAYVLIPVVIVSVSSIPIQAEQCMADGAAEVLVKPFSFSEYAPFVTKIYDKVSLAETDTSDVF